MSFSKFRTLQIKLTVFFIFQFLAFSSRSDEFKKGDLASIEYEWQLQQLRIDSASKYWLPEFQLKANYLTGKQLDSVNDVNQSRFFGLELSQNIYHSGLDLLNYKYQKAKMISAEDQRQDSKSEFYLLLIQKYIAYQLAKSQFDLQQIKIRQSESLYQLVESQYKNGFKKKDDFLDVESSFIREKLKSIDLESQFKSKEIELMQMLTETQYNLTQLNLSQIQSMSIDQLNSTVEKGLKNAEVIYDIQKDIVHAKYRWTFDIDLSAGYGSNESSTNDVNKMTNSGTYWSVKANFKYPLFDFGINENNKKIDLLQLYLERNKRTQELNKKQNDFILLKNNYQIFSSSLADRRRVLLAEKNKQNYFQSQFRSGQIYLQTYLNQVDSYFRLEQETTELDYRIIDMKAKIIHLTRGIHEEDFIK